MILCGYWLSLYLRLMEGNYVGYVKSMFVVEEDYLYWVKFNWIYDVISWMWFVVGVIFVVIWVFELFR